MAGALTYLAFFALGLAGVFFAFYVLWVLFLAVMNLSRAKRAGTLSPLAKTLGTPVLFIGWLLDFILNITVMTIVLVELPRETTVSERLERHNRESSGWRKRVALWFEPLLDPFDPDGDHV